MDTEQMIKQGFSPEEIQAVEKVRRAKERSAYEDLREQTINESIQELKELQEKTMLVKKTIFERMIAFSETANEYGRIPKDTQKNHTLTSADGEYQVKYVYHVRKEFDERAKSAEVLLKRFISEYVAAKAPQVVRLIEALLERNKKGDYDVNLINRLYTMENEYDHEDWKNAISLFKESYREVKTATYVNGYQRDASGKYISIDVNFSSLTI